VIKRIAIVNRGEAAMRLIHAVRELNAQGEAQIETVALYTDGERSAMFVREADSSYALGPAENRPYLDLAVLEGALRRARTPRGSAGDLSPRTRPSPRCASGSA
jgi:acetyl/propionyl-CoA carboxylase alpha subunit